MPEELQKEWKKFIYAGRRLNVTSAKSQRIVIALLPLEAWEEIPDCDAEAHVRLWVSAKKPPLPIGGLCEMLMVGPNKGVTSSLKFSSGSYSKERLPLLEWAAYDREVSDYLNHAKLGEKTQLDRLVDDTVKKLYSCGRMRKAATSYFI